MNSLDKWIAKKNRENKEIEIDFFKTNLFMARDKRIRLHNRNMKIIFYLISVWVFWVVMFPTKIPLGSPLDNSGLLVGLIIWSFISVFTKDMNIKEIKWLRGYVLHLKRKEPEVKDRRVPLEPKWKKIKSDGSLIKPRSESELREEWARLNGDEVWGMTHDEFLDMAGEGINQLARENEGFRRFLAGDIKRGD